MNFLYIIILLVLSFGANANTAQYQSELLERMDEKDKIVLKFAIEECKPMYLKHPDGSKIEVYNNDWPCKLPEGKRFSGSTARVLHIDKDRKLCPPTEDDISRLKSKWICSDENWRLSMRQFRKEGYFVATYLRADNIKKS